MFLLTNAAVAALVMVSVLVVTMPDACEDVMRRLLLWSWLVYW